MQVNFSIFNNLANYKYEKPLKKSQEQHNCDTNLNNMPHYAPIKFAGLNLLCEKTVSKINHTKGVCDFMLERGLIDEKLFDELSKSKIYMKNLQIPLKPDFFEQNLAKTIEFFRQNDFVSDQFIRNFLKNPHFLYKTFDDFSGCTNQLVEKYQNFGLKPYHILRAILKNDKMLDKRPNFLISNIENLTKRFTQDGLTQAKTIQMAINEPKIFTQDVSITEEKIRKSAKELNVSLSEYLKMKLAPKQKFYVTLSANKEKPKVVAVQREELEKEQKTTCKQVLPLEPMRKMKPAYTFNPKSIILSLKISTNKSFVEYLCANKIISVDLCEKLLNGDYRTIYLKEKLSNNFALENVKKLNANYKNNGFSYEKYLRSGLENPFLFHLPCEKIDNFIEVLMKNFPNEHIKKGQCLSAILKYPKLMTLSPEKICDNIKAYVKDYEKYGMTLSKFLKTGFLEPRLLRQNYSILKSNTDLKIELSKNIKPETCLDIMLQNPESLFQQNATPKYLKILSEVLSSQ